MTMIKQIIASQYIKGMKKFYEYTHELRRFFVRRLAQVLYNHVEHPANPRDKIDWFTAEDFIDNNLTCRSLESITSDFLCLCAYTELRKTDKNLPEIKGSIYLLSQRDSKELRRIHESLLNTNKSVKSLMDSAEPNKEEDKQLFLGRYVWDEFYKKIQDTVVLGKRGYARVLWH